MAFTTKLLQMFGQKFYFLSAIYILVDPGHVAMMAAMPIYGKNPSKIFFFRNSRPIAMKFGI